MTAAQRALATFAERFEGEPRFISRSPGRVNLIGEHTDYNDGFCLPMALPFDTAIIARPIDGSVVRVTSEGFGTVEFDVNDDPADTLLWARYLHGMAAMLIESAHSVTAWEGTIASDIPLGASLSSSAALEMAAGLAFTFEADTPVDLMTLARLGQRVENAVFGLPSGILDQLACGLSTTGTATLLDCRDLSHRPVPIPTDTRVMVMDSMSRRELVQSEYADRHATCTRVAAELGVAALRDATPPDLDRLGIDDLFGRRRAMHVITENQRTLDAAAAFEAGDAALAGRLMTASHVSLRDDFNVSGPELDTIVDLALDAPGCLGARMTGGGFAGCAVALVDAAATGAFTLSVRERYEAATGVRPDLWTCTPAAGASLSRL